MANIINGTDTGSGGLITTGDSSDELQLQTAETTAVTITSGQQSAFIAGTASAPAVTTTGDLNTGIYFPAADNIGFATGGTIRGRWTTDGLCFGTDTAAANALDDYEEGTFTPTLIGTTTAGSPTYTTQLGKYTKIGNVVIFNLLITLSNKGGMVGSIRISSLPFPDLADSISAAVSIGNVSGAVITAGETVMGRVINNSSSIALLLTDSANGNTNLADTEIGDTFTIDVAGSYFV